MASRVLHGLGSVTYTNSTGQNVRVVINFLTINTPNSTISITADSGTTGNPLANGATYGKTLAYAKPINSPGLGEHVFTDGSTPTSEGIPMEFALDNGGTFTITSSTTPVQNGYNIIIIPEAG